MDLEQTKLTVLTMSDPLFDKRVKLSNRAIALLERSRKPIKDIRKVKRLMASVSLVVIVKEGYSSIVGCPVIDIFLDRGELHGHVQVNTVTGFVIFSRPYGESLRRPIINTAPLSIKSSKSRPVRTCVRHHRRQIRQELTQYRYQYNAARS